MKTIVIGRETPLLTYQIFASLAHQNAIKEEARTRREARRQAITGFLRKLLPFIGSSKPHWTVTVYPTP